MNCRQVFSLPVRLISRCSIVQAKASGVGSITKNALKLEDEKVVPVEKDTEKLAKYLCGSNLFVEGEDVKLKPDSEYPDWLWNICPPLPIEQLDKNSKAYWKEVQKEAKKEDAHLKTLIRTSTVHK